MKQYFTILVLCSLSFLSVHAQLAKGTRLLGGNFSFSTYNTSETSDNNQTSFAVEPSIAKFYKENRAVGLSLSYGHTFRKKLKDADSFSAGVFLRQYRPISKSRFFIFLEEGLFSGVNRNLWSSLSEPRSFYVSAYAGPALSYVLTNRFQLELFFPNLVNISYQRSKEIQNPIVAPVEITQKSFSVNSGFQNFDLGSLTLGFNWLLP